MPDVSHGQHDWFILDHVAHNGSAHQRLLLDPHSFVVIMFVGTNDVGIGNFVNNNQSATVSLAEVADCQLAELRRLRALGARQFVLNSLIPLHLTALYSGSDAPAIYFPYAHNGTAWRRSMYNLVHSLDRALHDGARALKIGRAHV